MKWEYKVVYVRTGRQRGVFGGGGMEKEFNALGSQGWELVNVEGERAIFKRLLS